MAFLLNGVPWRRPCFSEGAGAARDSNAAGATRSFSKTGGGGREPCGGGSGPPKGRGFGRSGWGGGGGDDDEGRFGGDEEWGQEQERLAALGAAQVRHAGGLAIKTERGV